MQSTNSHIHDGLFSRMVQIRPDVMTGQCHKSPQKPQGTISHIFQYKNGQESCLCARKRANCFFGDDDTNHSHVDVTFGRMMKAITATAMIVVVLSLASLPTTNGQGAASSNANSWAPADVLSWAKQLSTSLKPDTTAKLLSGLEEHGVTGKILLWIEEHDLQEDFGIESSLQRKTVLQAIGELHGQGEKMDFWEYRSMNRKQVETITGLLAASPRWAIAAMKDVPEHGQPPTMGETPSDW